MKSVKSFGDSPSHVLATSELRRQVRDCIDLLPDPYRTVLLLRDIEEFDTETIVNLLNVSAGVVKTRLHCARQALRSLLEPLLQLE